MPTYSEDILRLAETTPVEIPEGARFAEVFNRLCGDKVRVAIDIEDGIVERVRWHVEGCAILRASTAFMARFLAHKKLDETYKAIGDFNRSFTEDNAFHQGPLRAIYQIPARYKCALLPWQACENLLGELKR